MTLARCLIALVAVAPFAPAQDQLGTWNQWRGPARSGFCDTPKWPDGFDDGRLQRQWRVELGPSYSGPVVDRERVYTTETVDEAEELVTAWDRFTGEKVWEVEWEGAMTVPFFAKRNGSWIRSTPALADGYLYVGGIRDVLVSIRAETGDVRWRVDFTERYGTPIEAFGFVCSPLVVGEHLYVQTAAGVLKLDAETGETVWRGLPESGGMMGGAFSSPIIATVGGREQLVVQTRLELCGVALDTGEQLWNKPVKTFRAMNILTPQPWDGGIFTSAYGGRAHFFDMASSDDGWSVEERWTNRAQGYMTSPVIIDDHAYLFLRSKRFSCVDMRSGEVAWISEPQGNTYWSLVAQGDRMLALTDDGKLKLIQHDVEKLDVIDTAEVSDQETWAHLAVDGRQLFIRELRALSGWGWRQKADDHPVR